MNLKEQKIESLTSEKYNKQVYESITKETIKDTISESKVKPKLESKNVLEQNILEQKSNLTQSTTQNITQNVNQGNLTIDSKKLNLKINKIKLNFYTNFLSYFVYNSKVIILGENKLFLFDLNDFNNNDLNLKEIKINYLSLRFKGVSFIDNKLFIFGNSGQIVIVSDLSNLINSLELNDKNSILIKIGYSDINNIIRFNLDNYLVIVNGKIYLLDSNFKILQEKSISIINGINYDNNLIFGNTSGEIIFLNSNFDIDKKISTNSFYSIKNFRIVNDKLFALSNGFIGYIENNSFNKISLPKSFIEANDINYINNFYFIVANSGSIFYSYNLVDILDFNSGIYENINSILKVNEKFMIFLCNSSILLSAEIL